MFNRDNPTDNPIKKLILVVSILLTSLLVFFYIIGSIFIGKNKEKEPDILQVSQYENRSTEYIKKEFPDISEPKLNIIKNSETNQIFLNDFVKEKDYERINLNGTETFIYRVKEIYHNQETKDFINLSLGTINLTNTNLVLDYDKSYLETKEGDIFSYLKEPEIEDFEDLNGSSGKDFSLTFDTEKEINLQDVKIHLTFKNKVTNSILIELNIEKE